MLLPFFFSFVRSLLLRIVCFVLRCLVWTARERENKLDKKAKKQSVLLARLDDIVSLNIALSKTVCLRTHSSFIPTVNSRAVPMYAKNFFLSFLFLLFFFVRELFCSNCSLCSYYELHKLSENIEKKTNHFYCCYWY